MLTACSPVSRGSRGVVLEKVYFKAKIWTSKEAIDHFRTSFKIKKNKNRPQWKLLKEGLPQSNCTKKRIN
jgi:hypothetical protein